MKPHPTFEFPGPVHNPPAPARTSCRRLLNATMLLAVLLLLPPRLPAQAAGDPFEALAKFSFGQGREPLARMEELIRKAPPAEYPALEARLIAILQAPETSKDAKRYICRYLGIVGSAKCVPAVAPLLTDPDLSHPARMALEPMPGPEAGAALRAALPKAEGKLLAGLLGSIGVRRDPQAVEAVSRFINHADPWIAETALAALGQIGTPAAARVLADAKVPASLSRALARAQIEAGVRLADGGNLTQARAFFTKLSQADQPHAIRVAANKALINTLPAPEAARRVAVSLQGTDVAARQGAISAFIESTNRPWQGRVAAELPAMQPEGQLSLLGLLADLPEVPARGEILRVLNATTHEAVGVAAINCLAVHGEAADVPMLAERAGGGGPVADAAKRALQRLGKPGVDAALVKLIESPGAASAAAMEALANRRAEAALPSLQRIMLSEDPALAARGLRALGMIGKAENVREIAGRLATTAHAEVRQAAETAAIAICRRSADKPALAAMILEALPKAASPAARGSLLQLLVYTGGEPALKAVVAALNDQDADVRKAAFQALVSWPDLHAGPPLLALARSATDANQSVVALRDGCLRLAEMEDLPLAGRVDLLRGVLDAARRPEEKKRAIAILGELAIPSALEILLNAAKDPALQPDAFRSVIRLARQMGGVYPKPALAALEQVKNQAAADDLKQQAEQAIKAVQNAGLSPDGFVLAWVMSGPYLKEGKDGAALFDEVFPPEQTGAAVEWRPLTASRNGMVEFDKILRGGNDRVAYLKTQIVAEAEQEALLEMGSDDGIKVWLNGRVVHANNAVRPCTPGQDKRKIRLIKGVNTLLVKVTQGGGQWAACVRLRTADGKDLTNVTVGPAAE